MRVLVILCLLAATVAASLLSTRVALYPVAPGWNGTVASPQCSYGETGCGCTVDVPRMPMVGAFSHNMTVVNGSCVCRFIYTNTAGEMSVNATLVATIHCPVTA